MAQVALDWHDWLKRWDTQQAGYLPDREERFQVMLDVLQELMPEEFVALDLACGPGAISQRLLARFPKARCVAVDLDPVLLAMGQATLGTMDGRLRWVEADLNQPDWIKQLGETRVNCVLSTTALHWLPAESLVRVYHQLGQLVTPGGVVLNGDHLDFSADLPAFQKVSEAVYARIQEDAFQTRGVENWTHWWEALAQEPEMQPLLVERERRFAWRDPDRKEAVFDLHVGALRDAGFAQVGVIWQKFNNRVLMAVR